MILNQPSDDVMNTLSISLDQSVFLWQTAYQVQQERIESTSVTFSEVHAYAYVFMYCMCTCIYSRDTERAG